MRLRRLDMSGSQFQEPAITRHAEQRMQQRAIRLVDVEAVMEFGREVHTRGATIYAVGHREVEYARSHDVDIENLSGIQIILCDDAVVTVYRNHDFSGLRPGKNHYRRLRAA